MCRSGHAAVINGMEQTRLLPRRCHGPPAGTRAPPYPTRNHRSTGTSNALEWTRTTTGREAHKALNLDQLCHMGPAASDSSVLSRFVAGSNTSEKLTCVKHLSRHGGGEAASVRSEEPVARRARCVSEHLSVEEPGDQH